jgi:hypothetical protein
MLGVARLQLVELGIPLPPPAFPARHPKVILARPERARQVRRLVIGSGRLRSEVIAIASFHDTRLQCCCGGSPGSGSVPVPQGPGLEVLSMPVASGQLIGRGSLLVCVGGVKIKGDSLVYGLCSARTGEFDAPVQLRNPLLELIQVAPREQRISAAIHIPSNATPPAGRLKSECPIWSAEGPGPRSGRDLPHRLARTFTWGRPVTAYRIGGRLRPAEVAFGSCRRTCVPKGVPAGVHSLLAMSSPEDLIPEYRCWQLLATASVGRLALSVRALPVILPVQYCLDGRTLLVCLGHRQIPERSLNQTIIAFAADAIDPAARSGWSVHVQGRSAVPQRLGVETACGEPSAGQIVQIQPGIITGHRVQLGPFIDSVLTAGARSADGQPSQRVL